MDVFLSTNELSDSNCVFIGQSNYFSQLFLRMLLGGNLVQILLKILNYEKPSIISLKKTLLHVEINMVFHKNCLLISY